MKWILAILLLIPTLAFGQSYNATTYTAGSFNPNGCGGRGGVCQADLSTLMLTLPTGTMTYCKDCNQDSICTPNGQGALAMIINGAWTCGFGSGGGGNGTACETGSFNSVGTINFQAGPGAINIAGNTPNSAIYNVNVNGVINAKAYGAMGDGVTNDTAAIQAAFNATNHGQKCLYVPAGKYLITQDLNLTSNSSQSACIIGDSPFNTEFICTDTGGNCLDFSGDDAFSVRDINIQGGTSAANAPKITILMARTSGNQGFGHTLTNVWTSSFGPYTIYDYGAEIGHWIDVRSNSRGVVISECNHGDGVNGPAASQFQTVVTGQTSMSVINAFGGNYNAGGGWANCAVYLDNSCSYTNNAGIHDINFTGSFFGEMSGGGTGICDVASYPTTGQENVLGPSILVQNTRLEAADNSPAYEFANLGHSYVIGLRIENANMGVITPITNDAIDIGCLDDSTIDLSAPVANGAYLVSASCGRGNFFKNVNPGFVSPDLQNTYNSGTNGNMFQWFDGNSPYWGHVDAGGVSATRPQNVIPGTAGTIWWTMPAQGVTYKEVIILFQNYTNTTSLPITFPVTFLAQPIEIGTCPTGFTFNGAVASVPTVSAAFSGQCILKGM